MTAHVAADRFDDLLGRARGSGSGRPDALFLNGRRYVLRDPPQPGSMDNQLAVAKTVHGVQYRVCHETREAWRA